jgi:hypothetical protein
MSAIAANEWYKEQAKGKDQPRDFAADAQEAGAAEEKIYE